MARYIDADVFEVVTFQGVSECFLEGADYILEMIDNQPTCDVVPRSEVEHWKVEANHYQNLWCQECKELEQVKQEIARMVFEELETSLFYKFINGEIHFAIREADYNHYKKKYVGEVTGNE